MPQVAGDASILASTMPTPRVKDLQEANACLRRLKETESCVPITIQPIPKARIRLICFADSSLGNAEGGHSQMAHIVCAVDADIFDGKRVPCSILTWKSHKSPRVGSSTLLVEANAMSEALAGSEWVATWIGLAFNLGRDTSTIERSR